MNIALLVAYDGTDYHGSARQPEQATVQGLIDERLSKLLRAPIGTTAAGRTDAGVHAEGQVFNVRVPDGTSPDWLRDRLNAWSDTSIVVRAAAEVPDEFNARFSAIRRRYRYRIYTSATADPFQDRFAWWVRDRLALAPMRAATKPLIGTHDFTSFCRKSQGPPTRRLRKVTITSSSDRAGQSLEVWVEADSFCQQMVRSIVGWMVACGKGDRDPSKTASVLAAKDRHAAAPIAPARGLSLMEVRYPQDPFAGAR